MTQRYTVGTHAKEKKESERCPQWLNVCLLLASVAGIQHGFIFAACIRVGGV